MKESFPLHRRRNWFNKKISSSDDQTELVGPSPSPDRLTGGDLEGLSPSPAPQGGADLTNPSFYTAWDSSNLYDIISYLFDLLQILCLLGVFSIIVHILLGFLLVYIPQLLDKVGLPGFRKTLLLIIFIASITPFVPVAGSLNSLAREIVTTTNMVSELDLEVVVQMGYDLVQEKLVNTISGSAEKLQATIALAMFAVSAVSTNVFISSACPSKELFLGFFCGLATFLSGTFSAMFASGFTLRICSASYLEIFFLILGLMLPLALYIPYAWSLNPTLFKKMITDLRVGICKFVKFYFSLIGTACHTLYLAAGIIWICLRYFWDRKKNKDEEKQ